MKTVYVIRGNQDGVLGVASNIKAAYRIALGYVLNDNSIDRTKVLSYQKTVNRLRDKDIFGEVSITDNANMWGIDASIEPMQVHTK